LLQALTRPLGEGSKGTAGFAPDTPMTSAVARSGERDSKPSRNDSRHIKSRLPRYGGLTLVWAENFFSIQSVGLSESVEGALPHPIEAAVPPCFHILP
jgi:hypothetical protein